MLMTRLATCVLGPALSCGVVGAEETFLFVDSGQALGNSASQSVALGDLDGDGDLDAMVANPGNQPNAVWTNDGNGTFTDSGQALGNSASLSVALGDLDGDGDLDAMVANFDDPNTVWFNRPPCTADINADGFVNGEDLTILLARRMVRSSPLTKPSALMSAVQGGRLNQTVLGSSKFATMASRSPSPSRSPRATERLALFPSACPESVKVPLPSLVQTALGWLPGFATMASRSPSPSRSPRATDWLALFPSACPESTNRNVSSAPTTPQDRAGPSTHVASRVISISHLQDANLAAGGASSKGVLPGPVHGGFSSTQRLRCSATARLPGPQKRTPPRAVSARRVVGRPFSNGYSRT